MMLFKSGYNFEELPSFKIGDPNVAHVRIVRFL